MPTKSLLKRKKNFDNCMAVYDTFSPRHVFIRNPNETKCAWFTPSSVHTHLYPLQPRVALFITVYTLFLQSICHPAFLISRRYTSIVRTCTRLSFCVLCAIGVKHVNHILVSKSVVARERVFISAYKYTLRTEKNWTITLVARCKFSKQRILLPIEISSLCRVNCKVERHMHAVYGRAI